MRKTLFGALFIFTFSAVCFAFPNVFPAPAVNGPTGLIIIPTADVIPYKNFALAADYGTTSTTGEARLIYKMNLGTFHGIEFGIVGGTPKEGGDIREGVFVNTKLSLSTGEEPNPLLLAIGAEKLFSFTDTDVYMVATKYMPQGPKLTFGFMADFPANKFRPLGIGGVEFPMGNTLFLALDMLAGETLFQVNGGVRFYFTPIFSVQASAVNFLEDEINPRGRDIKSYLIGISWANPF